MTVEQEANTASSKKDLTMRHRESPCSTVQSQMCHYKKRLIRNFAFNCGRREDEANDAASLTPSKPELESGDGPHYINVPAADCRITLTRKEKQVKYLGCYVDDSNRMLAYREWNISCLTLEYCKQSCFKRKDMNLGLQASYACFCGNSFGDPGVYQTKNDSECNRPCTGNSSQICGGSWRNSVYELITATVPTTELTTQGNSTVITSEITTNKQSVTTTELSQSEVTTTDMTTPGKSSVNTLQMTKPGVTTMNTTTMLGKSEVTSVQPISPLECLCPCSKVGKSKWDFVSGINLTLDQLRELLKPE
ncbi:unnamed protein product [Mytilus coruscus]|uniref:WSC domain-containing protein n=1 Tax=Mytilus coruscus TaxID=42192 RepID=A0A6J8EY99_MYTCO|nr:unnamed protein product [Mytilus coruscus]